MATRKQAPVIPTALESVMARRVAAGTIALASIPAQYAAGTRAAIKIMGEKGQISSQRADELLA